MHNFSFAIRQSYFRLNNAKIGIFSQNIDLKLDAEKNIKQLAFSPGGLLVDEFDKIFSDLFGKNAAEYQAIVRTLINQPHNVEEIANLLKIKLSGHLSHKLTVFKECGFLVRDQGELSKQVIKENFFSKLIAFDDLLEQHE